MLARDKQPTPRTGARSLPTGSAGCEVRVAAFDLNGNEARGLRMLTDRSIGVPLVSLAQSADRISQKRLDSAARPRDTAGETPTVLLNARLKAASDS